MNAAIGSSCQAFRMVRAREFANIVGRNQNALIEIIWAASSRLTSNFESGGSFAWTEGLLWWFLRERGIGG
jgi:hypothetical protein